MLKSNRTAVTGGLSCGKSSVCRILKELGAQVVSADAIVHQLLSSNIELGQQVIDLLGDDIVVDGKIDRAKVADIVFNDPESLEALEDVLHPHVYERIEKEYRELQDRLGTFLFVAEVPLLYETQGEKAFDHVVAVIADREICLERFIEKTDEDEEAFENRMSEQMTMEEKAMKADYVIINNSGLAELKEVVTELFDELISFNND